MSWPARFLGICLLLSSVNPPCRAADCTEYREHLHWVSFLRDHYCSAVAFSGGYAFTGSPLAVLDVSNPSLPRVVAESDAVVATAIRIVGSTLYAVGARYLYIVDVSDPTTPALRSTLFTSGSSWGLDVVGSYAYIADGAAGLRIANVEDPSAPYLISAVDTVAALRVQVVGSYAYVADGRGGLQVVDVSDPYSPWVAANIPSSSWLRDIAVGDTFLVVAESDLGLRIFDISNPIQPVQVGAISTSGDPHRILLEGRTAYVVSDGSLLTLDLSVPSSPVRLGTVSITANINGIRDVAVGPGYAYLANDNFGFHVIDISNPVSAIPDHSLTLPEFPTDIAVQGSLAYISNFAQGFHIVDLTNPSSMSIVGGLDLPDGSEKVAVSGILAATLSRYGVLYLLDVSDPTSPALRSSVDVGPYPYDVALRGSVAYVVGATEPTGGYLTLFDLSDPSSPQLLTSLSTSGDIHAVIVKDHYAYLTDYEEGLDVVDVSDPSAPILVGTTGSYFFGEDLTIDGSYAYIADSLFDLEIVDIRDPYDPIHIGGLEEGFVGAHGVAARNGFAYLTRSRRDVEIIDVHDPTAPRPIGNLRTGGYTKDIVIVSDRIYYLRDSELESALLQCGEIPTPVLVSSLTATPEESGVRVRWHVAADANPVGFVVLRSEEGSERFLPLNVETPISPPGPYEYLDSQVSPDIRYEYEVAVLRSDGGQDLFGPVIAILDGVTGLSLSSTYPNPTPGEVHALFFAPSRQDARVEVVDPNGRRTRSWRIRDVEYGRNELVWDGRDEGGRFVPSGIYFIRIAQGDLSSTRSVLLLRR